MPVFVSAGVLYKYDAVVVGPDEPRDVTLGRPGDADDLVRTDFLNVDVHAVFPRRHVGQVFTVGGKLVSGFLRVPEKILHRDDLRLAVYPVLDGAGRREDQH